LDDQFFVGRDLLVAPILFPAAGAPAGRDVYLPAGSDWYAFRDHDGLDAPISGGRQIRRNDVGLDETPIYVRAGAILPMRSLVEQHVGELPHNPLEIFVYPGPDRDHVMYQDDGTTMDAARRKAYRTTRISRRTIVGGVSVRLRRMHDGYDPPEAFYMIRLPATPQPVAVTVAERRLRVCDGPSMLAGAAGEGYVWDASSAATIVKVFDTAADVTMTALFE
ncbi:MAG: glycosyl hydrolase family 31, partial [Bacteroidota bacterium]